MGVTRRKTASKTSVIVLAHGQLRLTRRCLESLRAHTRAPHNLIVIDNASPAPTRDYLRKAARSRRFRLVRNASNLPYARAMNPVIRSSRTPYQAWLNNDVMVGPEWLERLIAHAESGPRVGAVGPCTNDRACGSGRGSGHSPRPGDLPRFAAAWALRFGGRSERTAQLTGFCQVLKREAIEAVGPLDERFHWGEEDDDYSFRLRLAGYSMLLARDVFVLHEGHVSGEKRPLRQKRYDARNRRLLREKWIDEAGRIRRDVRRQLGRG